jgi:transcription-repair coupling factor (superfamily II helicase)
MITLFLKSIIHRFKKYKPYKDILGKFIDKTFPVFIEGPERASLALLISQLQQAVNETSVVVVPTEKEAEELVGDLSLFSSDVRLFPWLQIIPYSGSDPHASVLGERMSALSRLLDEQPGIVVMPLKSLLYPVPDPDFAVKTRRKCRRGAEISPVEMKKYFSSTGYTRVPKVTVPGEFAPRGEVLDFFPPGENDAVRIIFEYDVIEDIKYFDPDNQFSTGSTDSVTIYPVREVLWTDERIDALEENCPEAPVDFSDLRERGTCGGEHFLYPFSFNKQFSVLDYLPPRSTVYFFDKQRLEAASDTVVKEAEAGFYESRGSRNAPWRPEKLFFSFSDCYEQRDRKVIFPGIRGMSPREQTVTLPIEGPRSFFGNITYVKEELSKLFDAGYQVWVFSESETQAPKLRHLLKDYPAEVVVGGISAGFSISDLKIIVIQENEIFGRKKRVPKSVQRSKTEVIDTFVELNPGDYVVHVNYGIGRFHGIERVQAAGTERDYIQLEYADSETIFIPIEQVNLVQKYIGSEGAAPRLDRIGGQSWETRKSRVRKAVEDLAQRLLQLYSRRKQAQGFSFPEDTEWQIEFEAGFPYEETPDQLTCIDEVKRDMESPLPMDRLICGDVGFGKTEIAMRAAFKAVTAGKQVAFLAPTTILAEQHYENMLERFEHYPVSIAMLSRFIAKGEQRKTIQKIGAGGTDIIIGTHRILQRDVKFKNVGLIIIDEEQRFGVKDKERLKELKHSVDCLTLTATPIPRTLHMSLLKIRDMSLLRTPPRNRLPIETHIGEFSEETIAEAVRRELERNGQVFYLHNRIKTLEQVRMFLAKLVPEAYVDAAHGRMQSHELEDIMHRFIHGATHVLVSTSIIENGIDIPNVNTIIIDRADLYGLSQLYQLRGRVGRADVPAYAYLLYPEDRVLTETAMKRLRVLSEYTDLGSGFKIAMKDLEVRGAGNLLGKEQHGDILAVGFDMYIRLLDEAISELQTDEERGETVEVYLELTYTGYIPNSYIEEPVEKMEVYKRIASIEEEEELQQVFAELEDRFGPLPEEVSSLLALAEIRILCKMMKIRSLKERKQLLEVEFGKVAEINVDKLVKMMQESGGSIKLDPTRPNVLLIETELIGLKEKSEFIREKILTLM